ncbi:hypothetical protein BBBOND_0206200 [Babesia bigemina]|uniref:Uncharacterized protein n=1 Tax=Babesia bigemina TaxID=5866 RepID=A0A061D619_BABBI|nr:hypothetical protein BBBOND_0206200 [Babesia bigemina]CDR95462.1 hypothetical protein BBBOND_0206200 [Babesia bigemina]|eukprot:XP_012767648.1 hypothetical protein BBBOND_0206200 [Babesia bigemina]
MKFFIPLALYVASLINVTAASDDEQIPPPPPPPELTGDITQKIDGVDYDYVIPSTEKRFKVVMSLMDGDGLNVHLLEKVEEVFKELISHSMHKWTEALPTEHQDRFLRYASQQATSLPTGIQMQNYTSVEQAKAIRNALDISGKSFHLLFGLLFGDYAKHVSHESTKAEATQIEEPGSDPNVARGVLDAPNNSHNVKEGMQIDDMFLNLRFVLPSFANDLYELHGVIANKPNETNLDKNAITRSVMDWMKIHLPEIEANKVVKGYEIQQKLTQLVQNEPHLTEAIIAFKAYNLADEDLKSSVAKCKEMNAASFGTIGLLLAAVFASTMW